MITFKSKRNKVYLDNGKVYKVHQNSQQAAIEAAILQSLYEKQLPVPRLKKRVDNIIVMEYIKGIPLPDLLALEEKVSFNILGREICRWLEGFYIAVNHTDSSIIRGDVNGRNFLYRDGIIGVDFEGHVYGAIETDIGKLIAFLDSYDNLDAAYITSLITDITRRGIDLWSLAEGAIAWEKEKELIAMTKRRRLQSR